MTIDDQHRPTDSGSYPRSMATQCATLSGVHDSTATMGGAGRSGSTGARLSSGTVSLSSRRGDRGAWCGSSAGIGRRWTTPRESPAPLPEPSPGAARVCAQLSGCSTLSLAYAEALTARFLSSAEGRGARANGLLSLVAIDHLLRVRGVSPVQARVQDLWSFLFDDLALTGWLAVAEIPNALAELGALWRFLSRVVSLPQRAELLGFLARGTTASALAERVSAYADDTVDMAPF